MMCKLKPEIDKSLNKAGYNNMRVGADNRCDLHEQRDRDNKVFPSPDCVEIASMDSFPCSDAPGYYPIRL
jgi:hypothetical protein